MAVKKCQTEKPWIDFEYKPPEKGQKIKVLRETEFEAVWDGEKTILENYRAKFMWTEKSYWQSRD